MLNAIDRQSYEIRFNLYNALGDFSLQISDENIRSKIFEVLQNRKKNPVVIEEKSSSEFLVKSYPKSVGCRDGEVGKECDQTTSSQFIKTTIQYACDPAMQSIFNFGVEGFFQSKTHRYDYEEIIDEALSKFNSKVNCNPYQKT